MHWQDEYDQEIRLPLEQKLAEANAEIARLRADLANAGSVMVGECRTQIEHWSADWSDKRTIGQVFDTLATLSPIAAAARLLLAQTEAANDTEIGPWLRALAEQEKADG